MQHLVAAKTVQLAIPAVSTISANVGFSTTQLLILVLTSTVVASIVTQVATVMRDRGAEAKNRKFAALYLALALEDYGEKVSDDIIDAENEAAQSEEGRFLFNVRAVPQYPEVDWKALGIKRTVAAMSFRVEIDRIRTQLSAEAEFVDYEDVSLEARTLAVELGREAIALARAFRKEVGLPQRDMADTLDHFDRVKRADDERLARIAAYDARPKVPPPPIEEDFA